MQAKTVALAMAAAVLPAVSACGSSDDHPKSTASGTLGGPAPQQLVGTFKTSLTRSDAAHAPKPDELPIGPWTLVIGNSGGPSGSRALGIGNGDTNRVVYRFGVTGDVLAVGCNNEQGLPAAGSQRYSWAVHGRKLTLIARKSECTGGDRNAPVILSSHPWTKQGG